MGTEKMRRGLPEVTTQDDEPTLVSNNRALSALATALRGSAPATAIDPAFRAALRATLFETSATLRYAPLETPVGRIWVAYGPASDPQAGAEVLKLVSARDEASFVASVRHLHGENPGREAALPERIAARALDAINGRKGYRGSIDLSILTPFHRHVLEKAREIPRGQVRPYAWIAREIGHPAAVRAVGTALANNPVPFVIPCHRVVRSDGELGQYSGGGTDTKERLLTFEGVDVPQLRTLARRGLRYRGSRNTKIFCLPTCHTTKHAKDKWTVYFHSEDEAFRAGFRPCKVCRPAVAV